MNRTQQQSVLDDAEQLVARQDYSGATNMLQRVDVSQLTKDELATYLVTKTHALIYQGVLETSHIDMALELLRSDGLCDRLAKARLLKGLALDKQGKYSDAQQHYLESSVTYRNLGNMEFSAVAINLLGWTHLRIGDYDAAMRTFSQALELMRSLRLESDTDILRRKERDIAHNLAYLETHFGRLREGLQDYEEYPISRNELDSDSGRSYFLNKAKALALCGQADDCRDLLETCLPFLQGRSREMSLYWQWMGLSHYAECDFSRALECFYKSESELQSSESDLLPGIYRHQAECYWQLGQVDKAEEQARRSFECALLSRERVEIAVCYRLLAMVASFDRKKQSRQLFGQSLDLLTEMDSRYELAQTKKCAALSGAYSVEESSKLLDESNNYFDSESIPRLSGVHTNETLVHIAILQSDQSQRERIAEILGS